MMASRNAFYFHWLLLVKYFSLAQPIHMNVQGATVYVYNEWNIYATKKIFVVILLKTSYIN